MIETEDKPAEKKEPVKYRSVSQVKQFTPELGGCPYQYYLQRRERAWQKPAAWLPQGTAVHAVVEDVERSGRTMTLEEALERFSVHYADAVAALTEDTPNFNFWYWSGPYKGEADLERRHGLGLEQVGRYYTYIDKYPERVPNVYGGELAVELEFKVKFGDVEVRGFIDQVVEDEPVDVKTGNKPGDDFQLGTYGGVLKKLYDVEPTRGFYWMGRTGKLTVPYDISAWTEQRLADVYGEVDALILAEAFDPVPEPSKCQFCSVNASCEFSLA